MIQIKNGKVFIEIEGNLKETSNPELIGLAVLDYAENQADNTIIVFKEELISL